MFALDYISGSLTVNGQLDRENPLYSAGFTITVRGLMLREQGQPGDLAWSFSPAHSPGTTQPLTPMAAPPRVSTCLSSPKGTELNDDRTPSDAMVMTTFTILLIDRNDNAPTFNSSEYRVRITELAQVGFALPLFIQAEDKDEGVNSMFQVVLTGNNSDHFTISPTAVQGRADIRVRVAVPLDYEKLRRYSFSLYANESMSDHVGFARIFIDLINENDNRPIFSQPVYNISLPENTPTGTPLIRILNIPCPAGYNSEGTQGKINSVYRLGRADEMEIGAQSSSQ
ncbi:unnamed protein product [Boreogadus saida]